MRAALTAAAAVMMMCPPSQTGAEIASAQTVCQSIARHVDEAGGSGQGPLFLRSYEPGPTDSALPPPLATSAFAYDNALAILALTSCGDVGRAKRIGDAFVMAAHDDRTYKDGRIRNAYRAGPLKAGTPALPGWWDARRNSWSEDAYQDGTQTGNVAWVALALLALDRADGTPPASPYRETAVGLARWIDTHTAQNDGPGGFSGGVAGFDGQQTKLDWRSTEHNVDVHALGSQLTTLGVAVAPDLAGKARRFLDAMFDPARGAFRIGTTPDGERQPPSKRALDALTWPLIGVVNPPPAWQRSLAFAEQHLATAHGFDFDGDRHGLWTEGTAQASLVTRAQGRKAEAHLLLATALRQSSPSGYLFATDGGTISTGLKIGPESTKDDFFYFHRPHLGATAWAVLAATHTNPFTGMKVD